MNSSDRDAPGVPESGPDPGEPIRALPGQERDTSPDFIDRIRRRIYRRATASQVASYSWNLPGLVLLEMLGLFGHLLRASGRTGKDS